MVISRLKGKDRFDTIENYLIFLIFIGALFLSTGIGLTVISPKGFSIILAMMGALISFIFTVVLILFWLIKEFKESQ